MTADYSDIFWDSPLIQKYWENIKVEALHYDVTR